MQIGDAEYLQVFSELPDDVKARLLKPPKYKDRIRFVWTNPNADREIKAWKAAKCGARCRDGHACQMRPLWRKARCARHGGKSTGPKTPEGKARIAESNRGRAQARKEERRAGVTGPCSAS